MEILFVICVVLGTMLAANTRAVAYVSGVFSMHWLLHVSFIVLFFWGAIKCFKQIQ